MTGKKRGLLMHLMSLPRAVQRRVDCWLAVKRSRAVSWSKVRAVRATRVLVVCYGNIYRSPFAAAILEATLGRRGVPIEIRSAGFFDRTGRPTPDNFIEISAGYGINLTLHRSTLVDIDAVNSADLIVIMDRLNWDRLAQFGAEAKSKAVWLGAFLDEGPGEIADPYGRSDREMRVIAGQLHKAACRLGEVLQNGVVARRV